MEVEKSLLAIKLDSYCTNMDNYQCDNDIMVTITLSEYRNLVRDCATAAERIRVAENNKWEREQRMKELECTVKDLHETIYKLEHPEE